MSDIQVSPETSARIAAARAKPFDSFHPDYRTEDELGRRHVLVNGGALGTVLAFHSYRPGVTLESVAAQMVLREAHSNGEHFREAVKGCGPCDSAWEAHKAWKKARS